MTSSSSLPGVSVGEKPRRFVPRFHWELLACGVDGHELIGLDARAVRPEDAAVVREIDGVRWYRCVRCAPGGAGRGGPPPPGAAPRRDDARPPAAARPDRAAAARKAPARQDRA